MNPKHSLTTYLDAQNEKSQNKVILLGCAFLIDFMFFEVNKN